MQKKTALIISLLISLGIFISSFRFANAPLELGGQVTLDAVAYEAYAVGINTVLYDINGQINYTLQADRQTQFIDDTSLLEKPFIRLYQQGSPAWNVVAETGTVLGPENNEIDNPRSMVLNGNVEVYSINEFGNRTTMTTESLDINFDDEQLSTQEIVQVDTQDISQTSVGMFADLKKDEITFLKNTQGQYEHQQSN